MAIEWKCAGCGIVSPDLRRSCECITDCVYNAADKSMIELKVMPREARSLNMEIMNGDHAEFEIEHAATPPHERPDWPLPSFDAVDWAAAFCKIAKTHGHDLDEGWMQTWFANALMRGYREGRESVSQPNGN